MSGKIELIPAVIIAVSLLAAATDLLRGKIYNWLTVPVMVLGLIVSFQNGGWSAFGYSAASIALGLALYGWMFLIRVMGAGDVKLLMALGAWGGLWFTFDVAALGVLLGGVMAAVLLTFKGRIAAFARQIYQFFLTLFVRELEVQVPKIDRKLTMPYGVPIAAAAIWVALANPFVKWGIHS
ncbi:MAG: prepilin peptidase [Methylotenera sp.]|nr:prepilin peptidase [Oligoflexia bacterium]